MAEDTSAFLKENFSKYAESGFQLKRHTDVTVFCNGREFHAHKVILSAQAEFFDRAFDPDSPMVEARTGVINLDEEDAGFVEVMISFCYTCDLDVRPIQKTCHDELLRYTLIYSIADKYRVQGLKNLARKRFHLALRPLHQSGDLSPSAFSKLARKVFETTPSTDQGLREYVLYYASKHMDMLMSSKRFQSQMHEVDGFCGRMLQMYNHLKRRSRDCPKCEYTQTQALDKQLPSPFDRIGHPVIYCGKCGHGSTTHEWNKDLYDDDEEESSSEEESDRATTPNKRRRAD